MSIRAEFRQRGLALVIVMWILMLLTLMAGSFATTMRRETSVSTAIKTNAEAQAVAESGIILAQFMLKQSDPELSWRVDGTVYRLLRDDGEIRIRILSESGKVDINTSSEEQLRAVLSAATDDEWHQQRLLNAILDWRDADDDTRTLGAEKRQYQQARLKYGPSNSAFQSLEELQLVLGMDQDLYTRIEPWITVYSGNTEVNIDDAAPELLAAIAREQKARNIQDEALQKRLQGTTDTGGDPDDAGETFTSDNVTYTITAESILNDEAAAGLTAVVKSQSGDSGQAAFEILDWKPHSQGLSLFDDAIDYRIITVQDEFKYNHRP